MMNNEFSNKVMNGVYDYHKLLDEALKVIVKYLRMIDNNKLDIRSYSYESYDYIFLNEDDKIVVLSGRNATSISNLLYTLNNDQYENTIIDTIKCIEQTDPKTFKKLKMEIKINEG